MNSEERRVLRDALGAIEDELRLQRATGTEILKRLDVLIKMAGGSDAKVQALREDHDALAEQVSGHERRIRSIVDKLPAVAR